MFSHRNGTVPSLAAHPPYFDSPWPTQAGMVLANQLGLVSFRHNETSSIAPSLTASFSHFLGSFYPHPPLARFSSSFFHLPYARFSACPASLVQSLDFKGASDPAGGPTPSSLHAIRKDSRRILGFRALRARPFEKPRRQQGQSLSRKLRNRNPTSCQSFRRKREH